jgi:hypothetical protein
MAVALVMGNMIGSGIFLLPASLAPYGGLSLVGWVVSTSGALALALGVLPARPRSSGRGRAVRLHPPGVRGSRRVPGRVGLLDLDRTASARWLSRA